jgi:zinc protease
VRLNNGLRVFLVEDHEVPLVKGTLAMRGGQRAVPAQKVHFPTSRAGLVHGEGGKEGHGQSGACQVVCPDVREDVMMFS